MQQTFLFLNYNNHNLQLRVIKKIQCFDNCRRARRNSSFLLFLQLDILFENLHTKFFFQLELELPHSFAIYKIQSVGRESVRSQDALDKNLPCYRELVIYKSRGHGQREVPDSHR